jgi:hypothetical protein
VTHSRRQRRASVSDRDYDPLPEDGARPLGVSRVSIEPMDPSGVELLAGELLQLLEWAMSNEERRHG